jgi:hypothetical protein
MDGATKMFAGMFFFLGVMMGIAGVVYLNLAARGAALSGEPMGWQPYVLVAGAVIPFLALGAYTYWRGKVEEKQYAEGENRRNILRLVEPTGDTYLGQVSLKTGLAREGITEELRILVAEGRYRGYVDWKGGRMYLKKPSEMPENACPNCQAPVDYKSVPEVCPSCDVEIYR